MLGGAAAEPRPFALADLDRLDVTTLLRHTDRTNLLLFDLSTMPVLVATLVALVLLEAGLHRHEMKPGAVRDLESDGFIDFHRELLVRWDDEAHPDRRQRCSSPAVRCERGRTTLTGSTRRRTYER